MQLPKGSDRYKFIGVIVVLSLAAVWILTYLFSAGSGYRVGKPLDTPGWNAANEFAKSITSDPRFLDIGVSVVSESPLKLRVEGVIHPPVTLDELKDYIATNPLQAEIEYNVTPAEH